MLLNIIICMPFERDNKIAKKFTINYYFIVLWLLYNCYKKLVSFFLILYQYFLYKNEDIIIYKTIKNYNAMKITKNLSFVHFVFLFYNV